MTDHTKDFDDAIDRAAREIKETTLDAASEKQAIDRVWSAISGDLGAGRPLAGCDDFQAEIPAFIAGELPDARALLVGDHTRECVPCRRVLMEAKSVVRVAPEPARISKWTAFGRTALRAAAALLLVAGGYGVFVAVGNTIADRNLQASVETIEGSLQLVDGSSTVALAAGDIVRSRQVVRTSLESGAIFELADGTLVEMDQRSELSLRAARRGSTIDLTRGNIIVHAAPQGGGRLYVDTNDCEVAVKGTIFAVDRGLKGSRVSVLEGEVEVREGAALAVLKPGDQITTGSRLRRVPLEDHIAWSRDAEKHRALLLELSELRRVVANVVDTAPPRTSTFLLDLVPADTMAYAAMPNITEDLDAARTAFTNQIAASEMLSEWWQAQVVSTGIDLEINELLDRLQPIGDAIGDEAVVAVPTSMIEGDGMPLFMAELDDPGTFADLLSELVDRANAETGNASAIVIVDDPSTADQGNAEVFMWVEGSLFAASPDLELLRQLAARVGGGAPVFSGTALHARLSEAYAEGVGWIAGIDIATAVARATTDMSAEEIQTLDGLGMLDATTVIVERQRDGEWYATQAEVQFSEPRRGVMAWLAEPAAMGSLDFVSPQAYVAASAVTLDAADMFDQLMAVIAEQEESVFDELRTFEERFGINIRDDLAATFGGEATLALDGPMIPVPSWKLIVEVYDPETLIHTIETAVAEANSLLAENGENPVVLEEDTIGGRTYFTLSRQAIDGTIVMSMVDGYLVMAPSAALIQQAINYRDSGVTLASSDAFRALLPDNGYTDCSALVYRDLGGLMNAIPAEMLGDLEIIDALSDELSSGMICVFGEADRVTASATGGSLVGLGSVIGMLGAAEAEKVLEEVESSDAVLSLG